MTRVVTLSGAFKPWRAAQLTAALHEGGFRPASGGEVPDVAIHPADGSRREPFTGPAVHVLDFHGVDHGPAHAVDALAQACRGVGLVLAASEWARGFWMHALERAGIDVQVVAAPYVPPSAASCQKPHEALSIVMAGLLAAVDIEAMKVAAEQAAPGLRLHVLQMPGALGLHGLLAARQVRDALPGVVPAPWQPPDRLPHGPVLVLSGAGAADAVACAAAQGLPVQDTSNAAPPRQPRAMSPDDAAQAMLAAVEDALARQAAVVRAWSSRSPPQPLGPEGHVLVLSDEADTLRDVRVHGPFGAMHRRGAIGGYSVLRRGHIAFSTRPPGTRDASSAGFDAVWVHRGHSATTRALLQVLDLRYAFDIDDNLLQAPSYRPAFSAQAMAAAGGMVAGAAVVSCSTLRLARLLQAGAGVSLAAKGVVTPNLLPRRPAARVAGLPRAVVWASSDAPALTGARAAVVQAVAEFCGAHRLRLICVGAPPPEGFAEAGVPAEHVGLLPYAAYLDYLQALSPAILVCPLETGADPATQAFVDGKSDIKMLDALATGLVGVFSDALPYRDSTLPGAILCPNTHAGWLDGLSEAFRRCGAAVAAAPAPRDRDPDGLGLLPWAEALRRVRLPAPLRLSAVQDALRHIAKLRTRFLSQGEFDAEHYLRTHDDVRWAFDKGEIASAYDHYVGSGYKEGRDAQAVQDAAAATSAWWADLMHAVDRMEGNVARHGARLARLQADAAARRALRQP